MTDYSPTPWTVEDVGHELKVLDAKGYRVATVYRLRANADLLAASPQLLEACKAANNTIVDHAHLFNESNDLYMAWSTLQMILVQAIIAAEGDKP